MHCVSSFIRERRILLHLNHHRDMLQDSFGRPHTYLRLSITDSCNYRCRYCLPAPEWHEHDHEHHKQRNPDSESSLLPVFHSGPRLSAAEILLLAGQFVSMGIQKIRLTGGEPLLRRDAAEIIEGLSALPVELCLSTNASLLHNFDSVLRRCAVRSLNVSIDSLRSDRFKALTGVDDLHRVRRNIENCLQDASGFYSLKINVVVMKGINDDEVLDFVEWTAPYTAELRFIEFMPFPGNEWSASMVLPSAQLQQLISQRFGPLQPCTNDLHDTARSFSLMGKNNRIGFISTMTEPFCAQCNRLRLSADGKLRTCLFGSTETDLLAPLRAGSELRTIIHDALQLKAEKLGGHVTVDWAVQRTSSTDRPMIAIGG